MKPILFPLSVVLGLLFLFGCDNQRKPDSPPPQRPQTSYGQAVKEAKDLNAAAKERYDQIEDEADEIDEAEDETEDSE